MKTYISLFSSAGVGCYAFKKEGFECIATNELIERRLDIQKINKKCKYATGYICGDITTDEVKNRILNELLYWRKEEKIKMVDVLMATPPCQGMSTANYKKGDEIDRNSLVVEAVHLVDKIQPRIFLFENVRAFLSTMCVDKDDETLSINDCINKHLSEKYNIFSKVVSNKKAVLSVDELSSFENLVRLSFADTIDCIANIINGTTEQAEINTQLPSKLEVNKVFDECFTALLELGEGFALSGNALSRSFANGTMFLQEKSEVASVVGSVLRIMRTSMDRLAIKGMRSSQSSRSNISRRTMVSLPALVGEFEELNSLLHIYPPSLRVFISTYLECTVGSSMWQSSEMWQGIAEHIDSVISSKQEHQAGLISRGIKGFDGVTASVCGVSCQAIAMMLKDCVVSIINRANYSVELERYRDSSNLSIDVELCMENISHLSTLRYDEYPQINTQFTSLENAIVEILEPFGVQINETFHTAISSLLVLRTANDTCLTDIRALSEEISAELANIRLTYFENQTTSEMEINASMEFDPASWNNPEFRDDGLHIWQIYKTTRTGDTLYLDKEDA